MNRPLVRYMLVCLSALMLATGSVANADTPSPDVEDKLDQLIDALAHGDHGDFISGGNEAFRSNLRQAMFENVQEHLGVRMAKGVERTFLASLQQYGMTVYVWKLTFEDGEDELITRLAVDGNGDVGGIWFH